MHGCGKFQEEDRGRQEEDETHDRDQQTREYVARQHSSIRGAAQTDALEQSGLALRGDIAGDFDETAHEQDVGTEPQGGPTGVLDRRARPLERHGLVLIGNTEE